jgi:hypothetical protein
MPKGSRESKKDKFIGFNVSHEMFEDLKATAKRNQRSVSGHLRFLLAMGDNHHKSTK